MYSAAPYSVSRLLGKLEASRHLTSGCDCAIAGAANAAPISPTPPPAIKLRRRMTILLRFPASATGWRNFYNERGLEISPPKVKGADADADQHQAEGVLGIGQKPELDPVALGDAGDRQIGGGADQCAIAAEAGAQRQRPPQRGQLLGTAEMRRQLADERDHRRDKRDVVDEDRKS